MNQRHGGDVFLVDPFELSDVFPLVLPGCEDVCFRGGFLNTPLNRTSVGGAGFSEAQAIGACFGEAQEGFALWEQPNDPRITDHRTCIGRNIEGRNISIAAEYVLRWVGNTTTTSSGLGAGATLDGALQHAALELLERQAVCAWWQGQVKGRAIEESVISGFLPIGAKSIYAVPGHGSPQFQKIEMAGSPPVVVAMSEHIGSGIMVFGAKAARTETASIQGAYLELRQAELGLFIKKTRDAPLKGPMMADVPAAREASGSGFAFDPNAGLRDILAQMDLRGGQVVTFDLTVADMALRVGRVLVVDGALLETADTAVLSLLYDKPVRSEAPTSVESTQ